MNQFIPTLLRLRGKCNFTNLGNSQPSGAKFYFCISFLRFYTASVDCDNSSRPKAVIQYWRNRIGIVGWFVMESASFIGSSKKGF